MTLSKEAYDKLKKQIKQHEGYRKLPYLDTTGHITIGWGHNLTDLGISDAVAEKILEEDLLHVLTRLPVILSFWKDLNDARRIVLINMAFNLGIKGLLSFKNMLSALKDENYDLAALEMLASRWAGQVGERAKDLATLMRTGEF